MAFYALLMLVATIATVVITGIGVWFVKRTLDATLKAVEDTSEATEAMREANSIARHSSENQLRAWLGWDEQIFQFAHDDNDIFLGLHLLGHFKNTGATPALECQIAMAFSLTGEREIDVEKVRTAPNQKIVVAPNMFLASSAMPLNPQQIFDARERPITIRWKLTYQTYFGKEAFTDILAEMRFIGNYDPQVDARHISPGSFRMRFIGESTMT